MKSKITSIIKNINNTTNTTSSVYNVSDETTYKGITVYVRENYPYYNPQNDKIYYTKEEEAEDLYAIAKEMTKASIPQLDEK